MNKKTEKILSRHFKVEYHPYNIYEQKIISNLDESFTILEAGCGRDAHFLKKLRSKSKTLIGVDLEKGAGNLDDILYIQGDISNIAVESESVDLVISKAVFEHVPNPVPVFKEIYRVLKPGGDFIFLIPNLGDYVSIISWIIPNKFHSWIMLNTEGRKQEDTFPAYYKINTRRSINRICTQQGFKIVTFDYLGQYPSSLAFNPIMFLLGTCYEKIISRFSFLGFLRGWLLVHLKK